MLIRFITFLGLMFHAVSYGEMIEVYDLESVQSHFLDVDPETLVLWDVDETLIVPEDNILHPSLKSFRRGIMYQYFKGMTEDEKVHFLSIMYSSAPFRLLHSLSVEIIKDLQAKKIPVMALTAMETGSFGVISNLEQWRYNQLLEVSIDFSEIFSDYSPLRWDQLIVHWNRTHNDGVCLGCAHPVFYKGILATDGPEKGPVLVEFLKRIDWRPKRVIFIDNDLNYLLSVQKSMEAENIPFLGFHYRAIEKDIRHPFNQDIAFWQFDQLIKRGIWTTDKEAGNSYLNDCCTNHNERG